jgi:ribosomal protein S18 acetylase RimI-like enzyme
MVREGEMDFEEADRLHEGLRRSFADFFGGIADAWLDERAGYRLVVCPSMPFPGLNGIWVDGPDEATATREIETAILEVETAAMPCWIEVRVGRTPTVERVARQLGFTSEQTLPGMVARPDELQTSPGSNIVVTRVGSRDQLDVAAAIAAAGFGAPRGALDPLYTPDIAAIPGVSIYLAEADEQPVSTAIAWLGDGGVGIFNVATPSEFRGRGFGRAVTSRAVHAGFADGADLAWLQASPLGEQVYRAMGFRQVDTYVVLGRPTPDSFADSAMR